MDTNFLAPMSTRRKVEIAGANAVPTKASCVLSSRERVNLLTLYHPIPSFNNPGNKITWWEKEKMLVTVQG